MPSIQGVPEKCTKLTDDNFATVCHSHVAKCSEKMFTQKGQRLNMEIKYSLFCSWQVIYLKTTLTAKESLRQICDIYKFASSPISTVGGNLAIFVLLTAQTFSIRRALVNKRSTVKSAIFIVKHKKYLATEFQGPK